MQHKALYYELVGMVLILASAGWQLFIERPMVEFEEADRQYVQDQKMDAIWGVLADMYTHQYPDRAKLMSFANIDQYDRMWREGREVERPIEWQAKISTWVTGAFFLIGSLMIVVAKWIEIKATTQVTTS